MAFFLCMATCRLSLVGMCRVYGMSRYHGREHGRKERIVNSGFAAPYSVVLFGLVLLYVDAFKISRFEPS